MSLDPPTYLNSLQNNIRARPIPWEGAVRAGHITDGELRKIKAVDKVRKEQRKQTVEGDLEAYRTLLLGADNDQSVLESAGKRADVIQYILVLASDLINDVPSLTPFLLEHPDPYKPFLPLLSQSASLEDPIPLLTSSLLATLISSALAVSPKSTSKIDEALRKLYPYLATLAKSQDSGLQDIAVQEYSALLRTKKSRELFWKQREDTINPLIDILRSAAGAGKDTDSTLWSGGASIRSATEAGLGGGVGLQLLYHVLLVIWQLSFEGSLVGKGLEDEQEIVQLYTQLLRLSPKEKTTRLLLSTLYNLTSTNRSTLLPAAVLARLPALLGNLATRHLTDPDLLEDLKNLDEMLDEYIRNQTTFDEYAAEVQSGHLRWSPPHRNPTFWAENARKILEDDKGALPKKLAEIMGKNWDNDKQVLAIACNDVANLVKEVPDKRSQLEKYGLKSRVMELMSESDETVRWESLRAVGEWLRYSFDR
ncbi:MAG: H(+)-transporting V1 sector ATPase subunit H [Pleopsidium flavum]|nr:MAG: H(+)-transporting V1 sector ATPase subunit H [Pleopsidium flavum]